MANKIFPLTPEDSGSCLFVATQSGPIVDPANGNPVKRGTVILNSPSAGIAMTLAAPRSGPQIAGGDDGVVLTILIATDVPLTTHVTHTVTCPANSIKGKFSVLNFVPDGGEVCSLFAWSGVWWPLTDTTSLS